MPKVVEHKKLEKKFYLSKEESAKLMELTLYYQKNGSSTVGTCIEVAYQKMKENKKETVLDDIRNNITDLANSTLQIKTELSEKLEAVMAENKSLKSRLNIRTTKINEIIDFLNSQPLLKGKLEEIETNTVKK